MKIDDIINQILFVGFVQGFIVIFFSIMNKDIKENNQILYLNSIIFFLSLNNLQSWLVENDFIIKNYYLSHLHFPWYFFLPFMFYFFVCDIFMIKRSKFLVNILLYFILISTIFKIIILKINYFRPNDVLIQNLKNFYQIEESIGFLIFIYVFGYSYSIFREGGKRSKNDDTNKWLNKFFRYSILIIFIWFLGVFFHTLLYLKKSFNFYLLLRLSTTIFIYWISYKGIFIQKKKSKQVVKNKIHLNSRYQKEFSNIEKYILDNESFTNSLLSIEELAKELGYNTNKLSRIIYEVSGKHFSDYINGLRVEKVKHFLRDKEFSEYTILSIGLEAGFNSKSVFYKVFKDFTGETPKQWKFNNG